MPLHYVTYVTPISYFFIPHVYLIVYPFIYASLFLFYLYYSSLLFYSITHFLNDWMCYTITMMSTHITIYISHIYICLSLIFAIYTSYLLLVDRDYVCCITLTALHTSLIQYSHWYNTYYSACCATFTA
jgi:hypothetical protein